MGGKQFLAWAESKIVPIQGDLIVEGLGISENDLEIIKNNVDIIINCAASVNFDDPLQDAININYYGAARLLELSKLIKNLKVFTHVSSAYVNCNRPPGYVDEMIYESQDGTAESIVAKIMAMSVQ